MPKGKPIRGVRLRIGDLCLAGVIGRPRPDVRAEIGSAPDDNTGFEIRGVLPAGKSDIIIEAQLSDDTWQVLIAATAKVQTQWLPLWLGGGAWTELMFFQMPGHMKHPPQALKVEKFPLASAPNRQLPRLSIVTPSFQQARYLPDTLRSVLEQTHPADEYVVQDGGSTDGSADLIRHHAKTAKLTSPREPARPAGRFTWESGPDDGQADAIVRGFAKTSGGPDDLMAWINSDDFYLPGTFAFVTEYFARHPDVDAVYGHRVLVDENSNEIGRWFLPGHDDDVLRLNDFVPQETLFWRRRLWNKVGGLDPSFKFAMDWDLLLRFQAAGARIVRLPYFLACFRSHSTQKTLAAMHSTGQAEITRLRERTFGRPFPPQELEKNPVLLRYLRRSAWIEFLWRLGVRAK